VGLQSSTQQRLPSEVVSMETLLGWWVGII
jgi:hypothetical protein